MSEIVTVLCWLWKGPDPRRCYSPEHVNVLRKMVARHLTRPHVFACIADSVDFPASSFSWDVNVFNLPPAARAACAFASPEGDRFPSCYRRLWTFSKEAVAHLGSRVLTLDVDVVVTGNIDRVFERTEDFVGVRPLKPWGNELRVAGGMYLLRTGTKSFVWEEFAADPQQAISATRRLGWRGSDQAWLSRCLGTTAATFDAQDGLYSIRDLREGALPLPADARLVQFNGPNKPWDSSLPWVREHWR